jgi:hypothetical protein
VIELTNTFDITGGSALLTVTEMLALVVLTPFVSVATALKEWVPFDADVVFHGTL